MRRKSRTVSFICTFFLGPIGLMYASPALSVMLCIAVLASLSISGLWASLLGWLLCIIVGDHAVQSNNDAYSEWASLIGGRHE